MVNLSYSAIYRAIKDLNFFTIYVIGVSSVEVESYDRQVELSITMNVGTAFVSRPKFFVGVNFEGSKIQVSNEIEIVYSRNQTEKFNTPQNIHKILEQLITLFFNLEIGLIGFCRKEHFPHVEAGSKGFLNLLFEQKEEKFLVIAKTSMNNYGVQPYIVSASDYFQKPIDPDEEGNSRFLFVCDIDGYKILGESGSIFRKSVEIGPGIYRMNDYRKGFRPENFAKINV